MKKIGFDLVFLIAKASDGICKLIELEYLDYFIQTRKKYPYTLIYDKRP